LIILIIKQNHLKEDKVIKNILVLVLNKRENNMKKMNTYLLVKSHLTIQNKSINIFLKIRKYNLRNINQKKSNSQYHHLIMKMKYSWNRMHVYVVKIINKKWIKVNINTQKVLQEIKLQWTVKSWRIKVLFNHKLYKRRIRKRDKLLSNQWYWHKDKINMLYNHNSS
jgi:hypothetical protein